MRFSVLLSCLLLAACTARYHATDLPAIATGDIRTFRLDRLDTAGTIRQSSILVVQGEDGGHTRWIQSDAFGAPQARLLATPQGWQRDGFVPPNREAERLFIALFPLINTDKPHQIGNWRITPLQTP